MKPIWFVTALLMFMNLSIFAKNHTSFLAPEGDWEISRNQVIQKDAEAPRAKALVKIPQKESTIYEFSLLYLGGGEDGHGGVGVHILADSPVDGISWGLSDSWLLWLNYDENPSAKGVPAGLSAQVYKSKNNKDMEIVHSIRLNHLTDVLMQNLNTEIPIKLTFVKEIQRVFIADPTERTAGWYVDLPNSMNDTGSYVAARTNGISVAFSSPDISL